MSYLVMECHPAYAVVLDSQGRFLKAANLGYAVGQELDEVIPLERPRPRWKKQLSAWGALAACLCLMVVGGWQLLHPLGTVQMQINPDVIMWVNRLSYVVKLEGRNQDGQALADGVSIWGKKVDVLSDELAQRAIEMGYLTQDGQISLTVESGDQAWKTATEELLVLELEVHLPQTVQVVTGPAGEVPQTVPLPEAPGEEDLPENSQKAGYDEDEDDEDDEDDDDEDEDDQDDD